MRIASDDFRMSQVNGARKKKKPKTPRNKNNNRTGPGCRSRRLRGTSFAAATSRRKWKIEPRDAARRDLLLGVWKDVSLGIDGSNQEEDCSSSSSWPDRLRKRLLVGRTMSLGTKKRSALFASGSITLMLRKFDCAMLECKTLQRHHRGGRDKAMEILFPLDGRAFEPEVVPLIGDEAVDRVNTDSTVLTKANDSKTTIASSAEARRNAFDRHHRPPPPPTEHQKLPRNGSAPRAAVEAPTQARGWPVATVTRPENVVNPYLKRVTDAVVGGSTNMTGPSNNKNSSSVASTTTMFVAPTPPPPTVAAPSVQNYSVVPARHPYAPAAVVRQNQVTSSVSQAIRSGSSKLPPPAAPIVPVADRFVNIDGHASPLVDHGNDRTVPSTWEDQSVSLRTKNVNSTIIGSSDDAAVDDGIFDEFKLPSQDDSSSSDDDDDERALANLRLDTIDAPFEKIAELNVAVRHDDSTKTATNDVSEDMFVLPTPDSSSDEESLGAYDKESGPAAAASAGHKTTSAPPLPLPQGLETFFASATKMDRPEPPEAYAQQTEQFVKTKHREVLAIESPSSLYVENRWGCNAKVDTRINQWSRLIARNPRRPILRQRRSLYGPSLAKCSPLRTPQSRMDRRPRIVLAAMPTWKPVMPQWPRLIAVGNP